MLSQGYRRAARLKRVAHSDVSIQQCWFNGVPSAARVAVAQGPGQSGVGGGAPGGPGRVVVQTPLGRWTAAAGLWVGLAGSAAGGLGGGGGGACGHDLCLCPCFCPSLYHDLGVGGCGLGCDLCWCWVAQVAAGLGVGGGYGCGCGRVLVVLGCARTTCLPSRTGSVAGGVGAGLRKGPVVLVGWAVAPVCAEPGRGVHCCCRDSRCFGRCRGRQSRCCWGGWLAWRGGGILRSLPRPRPG